jgi:hemoglobin
MHTGRRAQIVQKMTEETGIDEARIRSLVHAFYGKVRNDGVLGPIFDRVIGADWDGHLAKMCDFWSSVMLLTGRYKGAPMVAHMRLKMVQPAYFERWLELFRQTAVETCPPQSAEAFIVRAENIARSLQLGMFFKPSASGGNAERGVTGNGGEPPIAV